MNAIPRQRDPLTWGEYMALTPEQQRVWSRHWLDAYQQKAATAEALYLIGSFAERDFHEDWGSGDEGNVGVIRHTD